MKAPGVSVPQFWASGTEAQLVLAVVHDYPRWDDEGAVHYIERICILSGLIQSEDRAMIQDNETIADLKRGGPLPLIHRAVGGGG